MHELSEQAKALLQAIERFQSNGDLFSRQHLHAATRVSAAKKYWQELEEQGFIVEVTKVGDGWYQYISEERRSDAAAIQEAAKFPRERPWKRWKKEEADARRKKKEGVSC